MHLTYCQCVTFQQFSLACREKAGKCLQGSDFLVQLRQFRILSAGCASTTSCPSKAKPKTHWQRDHQNVLLMKLLHVCFLSFFFRGKNPFIYNLQVELNWILQVKGCGQIPAGSGLEKRTLCQNEALPAGGSSPFFHEFCGLVAVCRLLPNASFKIWRQFGP